MTDIDNDSYEFIPSEYDAAAERFMAIGVRALMEAQGGIYSLLSKESMSQVPDYSPSLPDDEISYGRPIEASSVATINYDDVISGDFDSILVVMDKIAAEMAGQITKEVFAYISEVCERFGNVVTGELSYDKIADAVEQINFTFNENGNHNVTLVMNPETLEKIRALGPPTPQQQGRIDAIISRRRDEWNARRGSRSLPPRRV